MPKYSQLSRKRLGTCHPKLQLLFNEVIKHWDCAILEGRRSLERQKELVARGASRTMNSMHLREPSLAVDAAPYPVDWNDHERFLAFGGFVLGVASQLGVDVVWGRDWDGDRDLRDQTFNDSPHFQLRGEK